MHCEEARATLLEGLDHRDDDALTAQALERHLSGCEACRELRDDLQAMVSRARIWHELAPPPWNAQPEREPWPSHPGPTWWAAVRQGLPLVASAAALVLAVSLYWREASVAARSATPVASPAPAPAAGAAGAERLVVLDRRERQQELEALTAVLKAEMDRRTADTEESLRYIIAHQIQSQRELDALRGQLKQVAGHPAEQL